MSALKNNMIMQTLNLQISKFFSLRNLGNLQLQAKICWSPTSTEIFAYFLIIVTKIRLVLILFTNIMSSVFQRNNSVWCTLLEFQGKVLIISNSQFLWVNAMITNSHMICEWYQSSILKLQYDLQCIQLTCKCWSVSYKLCISW